MNDSIIVATFDEGSKAYEGLARLKDLDATEVIDLHNAAVVEREADGTLTVRDESGTSDTDAVALTGGTVGLLIGILGGPLGVFLGGSLGLLGGATIEAADHERAESVLEHVSQTMPIGETTLLAHLDEIRPEAVDDAIERLGGDVERFPRADVEAEIAAADKADHEARRKARQELLEQRRDATRDKVDAKLHDMRKHVAHH